MFRFTSLSLLSSILFVSDGFQVSNHHSSSKSFMKLQTKLEVTPAATNDNGQVTSCFTSPPMKVYIEDTDAYGVMYNGNYLRVYERALESVGMFDESANNHWFIEKVTNHQFKGSPALGEEFVVFGEKLNEETTNDADTWKLEMRNSNNDSIVYNIATLTINSISSPKTSTSSEYQEDNPNDKVPRLSGIHLDEDQKDNSMSAPKIHPFFVYRDEMVSWGNDKTMIPLRNTLNLFERSRTEFLGGPDVLRKMEEEDKIVWVVTRVDDMQSFSRGCSFKKNEVIVSNQVVAKRGGMIIEFYHSLLTKENTNQLAEAKITVVALDAETRRPKRKLPSELIKSWNL